LKYNPNNTKFLTSNVSSTLSFSSQAIDIARILIVTARKMNIVSTRQLAGDWVSLIFLKRKKAMIKRYNYILKRKNINGFIS